MKGKKKRNKKGFNSWQVKKNWAGLTFWVHRKYGTHLDTEETKREVVDMYRKFFGEQL